MVFKKKYILSVFSWLTLFLSCIHVINAQPTCFSQFDPWDTCHWGYTGKDFVFLGRIVSVDKTGIESHYRIPSRVEVEIESPVKGNLPNRIELFLEQRCFGKVAENQRYIFTANRVDNERFSGLLATNWSLALMDEKFTRNDIRTIMNELRSISAEVKQPRLQGHVVEQPTSTSGPRFASGRYLIASREIGKIFAFGHLHPKKNVWVTARLKKTSQEYRTSTDADGAFVFEELPSGVYELSTSLPKEFNVMIGGRSLFGEAGKTFLRIGTSACSERVIFNAQLQGELRVRIANAPNRSSNFIVQLLPVIETVEGRLEFKEELVISVTEEFHVPDTSGDVGFRYYFKNVPAGRYVLVLSPATDSERASTKIYYPGTLDERKAALINIGAGIATRIEFNFPDIVD